MKKPICAAAFVAPILLLAGIGSAHADCTTSKNDFEDVYCLAKVYIGADTDLNAAYKALVGKLDINGKSTLKKGQLAWLKSRNDTCGQSSSDGYYVDLSCAVDTTRDRTKFLKARKAECDAGSCDAAKLGEEK
jgi:uncharacterized protein YecT (DUF1311 family)